MTFFPPDSTLLGPLFTTEAMAGVFSDRARLATMLAMEAALARAEAESGLVPGTLAGAVAAVDTDTLDLPALGAKTALSGVPTIPFLKAVEARLPPDLAGGFHRGATTQDVADTALALQMRDAFALLAAELGPTLDGLCRLAEAHRATPCVGRTYGQHGAPISFGFKAAVWAAGIGEAAAALPGLRERVLTASLAGPVGTLAALGEKGPAVSAAFARALGLGVAPIAWHARRARMVEAGAWLATLIGALAKMATDIANLASTEVAEVAEPYVPGRGGSSAMPHKRNPVSCTVILAAQAAAPGHVGTLLNAMAAAHERPVGLWQAEWLALPPLFGLAAGALREARALAEGLEVHPDRMLANLDATRGLLFADAVAGRLAKHLGREKAHALVEHAAGAVRDSGRSLREVLAEDPSLADPALRAALDSAFDLGPAVAAAALWADRGVAAARQAAAALADEAPG
ncbi:adenylosuccinate lyase family protein [Roseomonas sp. NAR14]|uniref:Adenylosuccinate lyase family protein n=1 Tax=Roseomonas acroporae TaxID=2937791 RepID=A0A9X1Y668_9PROT|nr:adenylosuccinate lyase family protein [Roseomonas acroporae]MCK8782960.1 adenylosuccinate lyase family protein [Roseomonas acroporae]